LETITGVARVSHRDNDSYRFGLSRLKGNEKLPARIVLTVGGINLAAGFRRVPHRDLAANIDAIRTSVRKQFTVGNRAGNRDTEISRTKAEIR
jgi:hypothetical protein